MDRKANKLLWGLGAGAAALVAMQTCDAGNLFKCFCDRDRCHTPDCRELTRKQPECDCRFGHFTTEWTPWAANCPTGCAPCDNRYNGLSSDSYSGGVHAVPIAPQPVPSYAPEPVYPEQQQFDASPYLPAPPPPQDMSLPLPPEAQTPNPIPQSPLRFPQPMASDVAPPQQVAPLPPAASPQPPMGGTGNMPPIPMPKAAPMAPTLDDFQAPTKSAIPGDSAFRQWRLGVQPTAYWPTNAPTQGPQAPAGNWRVMPGYNGQQPQQPVTSQPFYPR